MMITLIKEISERLKNPEEVQAKVLRDPTPDIYKRPRPWSGLSLSHGYPGILCLFAELDELYPDEGWDKVAHPYVVKIKAEIESAGIPNLSLFGGLAGCCLAIQQISRQKTRYQKLLNSLNDFLFKKINETYFFSLKEKIDLNLPVSPELYDPISGICGIGVYALKNLDAPLAIDCLHEILTVCVALTKEIKVGNHILPGWYVPRHYQFTELDKSLYPKGNYNLGIAHGIPGVLAFLSIAALAGVTIEGQMDGIQKITNWICAKKQEKDGLLWWPYHVSFEEEISEIPQRFSPTPLHAWCYGAAGVSRVLYLAGKALQNKETQKFAEKVFCGIFKHIDISNHFSTPSFCHGLAGFLTITRLMARDTGSFELNNWIGKIEATFLQFFDRSHPFGFKDVEPLFLDQTFLNITQTQKNELIEFDKVGLLEGISGILLALLPIQKKKDTWTIPFLIEGI